MDQLDHGDFVMPRSPEHSQRKSVALPAGGEGADLVDWIPDAEVNECPMCSRKFGINLWKHHCRACGRVVCAGCSDNSIRLCGHGMKKRVCDPCFQLRRHDKSASITDSFSTLRQVEASLKASLKEKNEQAEWFRNFLLKVGSTGGAATDGEAEIDALIEHARSRWRGVVQDVVLAAEETRRLRQERDAFHAEAQERDTAAERLRKQVRDMEERLRGRREVEVERDHLSCQTAELRRELEGLRQRQATLEANRQGFGSRSSILFSGSFQSSFHRDSVTEGEGGPRCAQCRQSCSVQ